MLWQKQRRLCSSVLPLVLRWSDKPLYPNFAVFSSQPSRHFFNQQSWDSCCQLEPQRALLFKTQPVSADARRGSEPTWGTGGASSGRFGPQCEDRLRPLLLSSTAFYSNKSNSSGVHVKFYPVRLNWKKILLSVVCFLLRRVVLFFSWFFFSLI